MAMTYNTDFYSGHRKLVELDAVVQFNSAGVPTLMSWTPPLNGQPGFYSPAPAAASLNISDATPANVNATTATITLTTPAAMTGNNFYQGSTVTDDSGATFIVQSNTTTVLTVTGGLNPTPVGTAFVVLAQNLPAGLQEGFRGIQSFSQNSTLFVSGAAAADMGPAADYTVVFQDGFARCLGVIASQFGPFSIDAGGSSVPQLPVAADVALVDSNFPSSAGLIQANVAPTATGLGWFQDSLSLTVPHTGSPRFVPLADVMSPAVLATAINTSVCDFLTLTINGTVIYPLLTVAAMTATELKNAINTAIAASAQAGLTVIAASVTNTTDVTISVPAGAPVQSFQIGGNPLTLARLGLPAGQFTSVTTSIGGSWTFPNPLISTVGTYGPEGIVYATVTSGQVVITYVSVAFGLGGAPATLANLGLVAGADLAASQTTVNALDVPNFAFEFNTSLGKSVEVIMSIDGKTYTGTIADDAVALMPESQTIIFTFLLDASSVG